MAKKIIIVLFLFLNVSVSFCEAQIAIFALIFGDKVSSENFYLSIDGGGGVTSYSEINGDARPGFNLGVGANYKASNYIHFRIEAKMLNSIIIQNTNQVSKIPDTISPLIIKSSTDWKITYIDLPIIIDYELNNKWLIGTGPTFLWQLDAIERTELQLTNHDDFVIEQNINPIFQKYTINWCFEIVRKLDYKQMSLRLRYTKGITNSAVDSFEKDLRSDTIQFIVTLPLSKKIKNL